MTEAIKGEGDADRRHNVLQCLTNQASEHFDSVLVIATVNDSQGGTYMQYSSRGNSYASISAAERWIEQMKNGWHVTPSDE